MRSTRMLAAAIAAVFLAMPMARAADLPPLAPQFHPVPEFSGWYLRGNVGMTHQLVVLRNGRRLSVQPMAPRRCHRRVPVESQFPRTDRRQVRRHNAAGRYD